MKHVTHLDWLTLTTKGAAYPEEIIPFANALKLGEQVDAPKWFDKAYKVQPRGLFAVADQDKCMAMLRLTGTDLVAWRQAGISDNALVQYALEINASVTRIDVAVNLLGGGYVPDVVDELVNGNKTGSSRTYSEYRQIGDPGHTVYFGSRKSDQYVRVYDKAAEMKLLEEAWTRVELQARRKKANALAMDMNRHGDIAAVAKTRIRELVDFPQISWWQDMLASDTADLTKIPRKEPALFRWLREQVAPQFRKTYT